MHPEIAVGLIARMAAPRSLLVVPLPELAQRLYQVLTIGYILQAAFGPGH